MEFVPVEAEKARSDSSTLVLPALAIGNVGQLVVDLLISSYKAERIGYLDDPLVLPCVGNDAYGSYPQGDLSLPLEAYDSSSNALTFVQQRSPVVKGGMIEFATHMADFAAAIGKKHVLILSSLDFGRWQNIDFSSGLHVYYVSSCNDDGTNDACNKLGWKKLEAYDPAQRRWKYLSTLAEGKTPMEESSAFEDEQEEEDYYTSLPFAALFSCLKAKGLEVTCLLCYCSEGDNIPEAFHLAEAASKYLKLSPKDIPGGCEGGDWVIPFSWKSVYGPPPDMSIF